MDPTLVTLPTLGTVAEAMVGQCQGCEDHVVKSRDIDLTAQAAAAHLDEGKARIEHAEADRREQRLAADPPDLSDPTEHASV